MEPWNQRPFEYRRLFNPAFCGVLLIRAMKSYQETSGKGLPFSLAFLILPLCLHEESRSFIQKHYKSSFINIVAAHPDLVIGFSERAKFLVPYTLEGLGYAYSAGSFKVTNHGNLLYQDGGIVTAIKGSDEVQACQKSAVYLGRAFSRVGSKTTIYTCMGVRP